MPSQQTKRYAIRTWYRGKIETEYYVDKYVHAYLVAKTIADAGYKVVIYDSTTGKVRSV